MKSGEEYYAPGGSPVPSGELLIHEGNQLRPGMNPEFGIYLF